MLPVDSRKSGKSHGPDEKGVVLDGVGVCRLIAPQHVELFLRDLARLDRRVAVLGQVLARRGVVVDAVPLFQGARRKDTVCKDEVEGEESRPVIGCGEGGRRRHGAEAEVVCERRHGWVVEWFGCVDEAEERKGDLENPRLCCGFILNVARLHWELEPVIDLLVDTT